MNNKDIRVRVFDMTHGLVEYDDVKSITTAEELDEALTRAFSCEGPYIVDCRIDKDEFVLPMLPPGGSMDDIIVKVGD